MSGTLLGTVVNQHDRQGLSNVIPHCMGADSWCALREYKWERQVVPTVVWVPKFYFKNSLGKKKKKEQLGWMLWGSHHIQEGNWNLPKCTRRIPKEYG